MAYLLDADTLIRAKNDHYGFDFCPAFWSWLIRENNSGNVYSVEKVGNELEAGNDELSAWASQQGTDFFLVTDPGLQAALGDVSIWATTQNYEQAAVNEFMQSGDYFLIAYAHAYGYTVVTHEKASSTLKKIKIPDVCNRLNIQCVTPYDMLRLERARFILGPSHIS